MSFFSNLFPYTNFHDINMDWILNTIKSLKNTCVFSINGRLPDESGNVTVPQVEGVTSVNGILPDQYGNVNTNQSYQNEITLASGISSPGWTQYVTKIGRIVIVYVTGVNNGSTEIKNNELIATGLFPSIGVDETLLGLVDYPNPAIRVKVTTQGELIMDYWNSIPVGSSFTISGTYFTE